MSNYWLGKKFSKTHSENISKSLMGELHPRWGKHHTEEVKRKISEKLKGRVVPDSVRKKIGESSKGRKHTEESKKKMSLARMGIKYSDETKKKMSEGQRGRKTSEETKKKIGDLLRGKKRNKEFCAKVSLGKMGHFVSEETKEKISKANKGKKLSYETRKRMSNSRLGEKSHFWQGGKTKESIKIRHSLEAKLWRETVFKRDNWTCVLCGKRSEKGNRVEINADHIKPFALFPELRFAIDNGRTLCINCHKNTNTYLNRWYIMDDTEGGESII